MLICNAPGEKRNMEKLFVTKLEIKKVRHLKDITINLSDTISRHLIFTGKNGSGKTSVLDAIAAYLKMKFQVSDLNLEKTKEMDSALTNNMEEYRTQKKAREKRLMAYAEEIQKNTLQMSSALIAELVAERKYQKKTQQDIADITGILPANIARFENGSRVPTLVVLQKYASALGKRIKVELCDQEAK